MGSDVIGGRPWRPGGAGAMDGNGRRMAGRGSAIGLLVAAAIGLGATGAEAGQGPRPSPQGTAGPVVRSLDDLVRLCPADLEALYRASPPAPIPGGKVTGRPVIKPGSAMAVPASKLGRAAWQGKVFDPANGLAVNRFFGVRMIRGELYYAESWHDGRPALILDYRRTSRVYGRYRDELREVAPGLLLGLMYDRTDRSMTRYFALDTGSAGGR